MRPLDDIQTRRLFTFDGAFSYVNFRVDADEEFLDFCLNHSPLNPIAAKQRTSDVNDLQLLHCFLLNERKATPTAAQLNMHRNTVLYRIELITKQFSVNLDDHRVRERLELTFRLKIASDPAFRDLIA